MAFDLQTFTLFHVLLSLAGIVSDLVVAGGLASGRRLGDWFRVSLERHSGVRSTTAVR
jgi:hypothetical protein